MYNNMCNNKYNHTSSGDCIKGMQATLNAIVDCLHECYNSCSLEMLQIEIILNTGLAYSIGINSCVLEQVKIYDTVVVFNDLTISICDIAKIKVLTSEYGNSEFTKCLSRKLSKIARCESDCPHDYLALDADYSHRRRGCSCSCNSSCKCNRKKGNDKNNCIEDLENSLQCNQSEIDNIGYNGSFETFEDISSIDSIESVNVVKDVNIKNQSTSVIKDINLLKQTSSVVSNINTIPKMMVRDVSTNKKIVVENSVSKPTKVLSDIQSDITNVVKNVDLATAILVNNVTISKSAVSGPVVTSDKSVVKDINTIPKTFIKSINTLPATAINSLGFGTSSFITGLGLASTAKVVTGYSSPFTLNALTSLGNPSTRNVLSGITSATPVPTVTQTVPAFNNIVAGGLRITIRQGQLRQAPLPIPDRDVSFDLTFSDGSPVLITGTTTIISLSSAGNLLNVQGTPEIVPVVTGYTPTSNPFVTTLGQPSTVDVVTGYDNPSAKGAIISITPNTVPIIGSVSSETDNCNCVQSVVKETIKNIDATPSVDVVNNVSSTTQSVKVVNNVDNGTVNSLRLKEFKDVVESVTITYTNVNEVVNVDKSNINEVTSINNKDVLTSAELIKEQSLVLNSSSADVTKVNVVNKVNTIDIQVLSPTYEPINGDISGLGCGVLVVEEYNKDISIYSICEINSFTTRCK